MNSIMRNLKSLIICAWISLKKKKGSDKPHHIPDLFFLNIVGWDHIQIQSSIKVF